MMRQQQERKGSIYSPYFGLPRAERERLAAEEARRKKEQEDYERRTAEEIRLRRLGEDPTLVRPMIPLSSQRTQLLEPPRTYQSTTALPSPPEPGFAVNANLYSQGDMGMEAPLAREPGATPTAEDQAPAGGAGSASASAGARYPIPSALSIDDLIAMQGKIGKALSPEQEARREDLKAEYAALEESGLAGLREAQKEYESRLPKGQAYEEREKRLREAEEKEPEEKEQNLKFALIEAGLGMLAGTSPYAMVNIGQGAQQGLKSYKQGISELKKAAEKREDLLGVIEQARRAETEGRAEKAAGFKAKESELSTSIAKSQIEAIQKIYNVDRQEAINILNQMVDIRQSEMSAAAQMAVAEKYSSRGASGRSDKDLRTQLTSLELRRKALKDQISTADKSFAKDPKTGMYLKDSVPQLNAELAQIEREAAEIQDMLRGQIGLPARSTEAPATGIRPGYDPSKFDVKQLPGR
jgi:predicted  nucleic acid-binding Zn-ribbon protein